MSEKVALKTAIDLMHVPSQVRLFRSEPLPDGVLILLRIAAGDREAEETGYALTGRSRDTLRKAAAFFIEQILFAPNVDSYRVLGANSEATPTELRRNVALLLKWLHPDLDASGERSVFVGRVTNAWNDLKTADRRSAYDAPRRRSSNGGSKDGVKGASTANRRHKRKSLTAFSFNYLGGSAGTLRAKPRRFGVVRRVLAALLHVSTR